MSPRPKELQETALSIKTARTRRKLALTILAGLVDEEVECGCCYGDYSFKDITQCEDGHLFCLECAKKTSQTTIGLRGIKLKCMSVEGCGWEFQRDQVKRFLPEGEFKAWENMKQEKEILKADEMRYHQPFKKVNMVGLDDFVTCPFCSYGVIMERNEAIFECLNAPLCGVNSCMKCKKKSHAPNPCVGDETSVANAVAEAMTEAAMRVCPGCKTKFFKTEGCNKMRCQCGVVMCYVCRKSNIDYTAGCKLWDDTVARNNSDAAAAGEAKLKELGFKGSENLEKLLVMPSQASLQELLLAITNRLRTNTAALQRVASGRSVNREEYNQLQIVSAQLNRELADVNRLLALEREGAPRQGAAFQFAAHNRMDYAGGFNFGGANDIPAFGVARAQAYNPAFHLPGQIPALHVPNQIRAPFVFHDPEAHRQRMAQIARDKLIITQRRKEAREKVKLARKNAPALVRDPIRTRSRDNLPPPDLATRDGRAERRGAVAIAVAGPIPKEAKRRVGVQEIQLGLGRVGIQPAPLRANLLIPLPEGRRVNPEPVKRGPTGLVLPNPASFRPPTKRRHIEVIELDDLVSRTPVKRPVEVIEIDMDDLPHQKLAGPSRPRQPIVVINLTSDTDAIEANKPSSSKRKHTP